jgi:hypothetical protein
MHIRDAWTELLTADKEHNVKQFLQGMINRMTVSHFKYGPLGSKFPHKTTGIDNARRGIDAYADDKNAEHLIDAANYLMIEFMYPSTEGTHFTATDSDGSLGYVLRDGTIVESSHDC